MAAPEVTRLTVYFVNADRSQHPTYASMLNGAVEAIYFSQPSELLELPSFRRPGCIVCDFNVGEPHAEALQEQLLERHEFLPFVFVGSQPHFSTAVRVMERGALTVLSQPLEADNLLRYFDAAFRIDAQQLKFDQLHDSVTAAMEKMTTRQRTVLQHVVQGLSTKGIAHELGVSQRLIEKERSRILELFAVSSTPDVTLKLGSFRILHDLRARIDLCETPIFRTSAHRIRPKSADTGL